jgi:hypothetical protein
VGNQIACDTSLRQIERDHFLGRTESVFPSLVNRPTSAYQLVVHLSQVNRAANRVAQQFWGELLAARLALDEGRIAEASSTTLLMLGSLAALGEQLFRQRHAFGQILPGTFSGALDAQLLRRDPQLVVLQFKYHIVADFDAEGLAKKRRVSRRVHSH